MLLDVKCDHLAQTYETNVNQYCLFFKKFSIFKTEIPFLKLNEESPASNSETQNAGLRFIY